MYLFFSEVAFFFGAFVLTFLVYVSVEIFDFLILIEDLFNLTFYFVSSIERVSAFDSKILSCLLAVGGIFSSPKSSPLDPKLAKLVSLN